MVFKPVAEEVPAILAVTLSPTSRQMFKKWIPKKGTVAKKWHEPRCLVNKNKGTIQGTVQYQIFKTVSLRFPLAGQLLTQA
jgi:hypothetical protein